MTTKMNAMDDDVDNTGRDSDDDNDDDAGNNASSTMSGEGDNRNHDNGEEQHWQRILSCGRGQGNKIIPSFICC